MPRKEILWILTTVVGFYISINLLLVNFAPIIHTLRLTVIVNDAVTADSIRGAEISWKDTNHASGVQWLDKIGYTDLTGKIICVCTIQEQPLWVWPVLGYFDFHDRILTVTADGYTTQDMVLASCLPRIPYSSPTASVTIGLLPQPRKANSK